MNDLLEAVVEFLPERLQGKAKALFAALAPIVAGLVVLAVTGQLSPASALGVLGLSLVAGGGAYAFPNKEAKQPQHAAV